MIETLAAADPARDATPTPAEAARMDAELHRLMAVQTPVRNGRRRGWVLAPIGLATAAVTLGVALPGGKTPAIIQPASASAATVLADLQRKVAAAPAQTGRYAYLKQRSYTSHMRSGHVVVLPHEVEQWVADDGTGVVKQVIHWDRPTFPTPEDEAAHGKQPQLPPLDDTPHARRDIEVLGMSVQEVQELPTDPAELRARLEDRDNVTLTAYAGALLSFAGTPQPVKVALFSVLKAQPGAELIPRVTDPLERTGVGVQFDDEAWRTLFVFDPATGALLGTRSIGKNEVPGRTIDDWNLVVDAGRTDSAPETAR